MSINESEAIKVYNNPKKGFWGKSKMLKKYREMLNKVYALQRHKEVTSKHLKKLYKREGAIRPFYSVQVDLADFPKLQNPMNKNVRYLLICIDVFSRYMWIVPLTSKANLHIPLRKLLLDMKTKFNKTPENITGDNEFDTRQLKTLANEFKFRWWFGDPHEKYRTGIVERSIRTLRGLIKRYLTQNDTTKYIDVLDELVDNYNDTEHSHIRTKPRVAITQKQTFPKPMKKEIPILKAGDMVRVLMPRQRAFDKGDKPYYSKELYEVMKKQGNKYHIRNIETGLVSKKTYYIHQLLHVKAVVKDKTQENNDRVGYDKGIEHKTKQRKNKRALKGLDPKNIINKEEREQVERDLHYNDEEYFNEPEFHDKPLPPKMSDKQLEKKQKEIEKKIEPIMKKKKTVANLKPVKNKKKTVANLKPIKNKKKTVADLKPVKKKRKVQKNVAPLRRSTRIRRKPKLFGYDY